jgi:hypothetical protein
VVTATIAIGTIAIGTVASPTATDARWRHHGFPVAPIIGGVAAFLGAALAGPPPYYAYAYEPVLQPAVFGPRCYFRRERI